MRDPHRYLAISIIALMPFLSGQQSDCGGDVPRPLRADSAGDPPTPSRAPVCGMTPGGEVRARLFFSGEFPGGFGPGWVGMRVRLTAGDGSVLVRPKRRVSHSWRQLIIDDLNAELYSVRLVAVTNLGIETANVTSDYRIFPNPRAPLVIDGAACVTDPDAPDPTANLWSTVTPHGVRLLWDSVHSSDDIYGYIVERSVDGSPWVDVAGGVIVDSGAQQEPTGQIYIRPDWLDPEALPGGSLAGSTIEYRVITEDLSANRSGPSTPVLVVLP